MARVASLPMPVSRTAQPSPSSIRYTLMWLSGTAGECAPTGCPVRSRRLAAGARAAPATGKTRGAVVGSWSALASFHYLSIPRAASLLGMDCCTAPSPRELRSYAVPSARGTSGATLPVAALRQPVTQRHHDRNRGRAKPNHPGHRPARRRGAGVGHDVAGQQGAAGLHAAGVVDRAAHVISALGCLRSRRA